MHFLFIAYKQSYGSTSPLPRVHVLLVPILGGQYNWMLQRQLGSSEAIFHLMTASSFIAIVDSCKRLRLSVVAPHPPTHPPTLTHSCGDSHSLRPSRVSLGAAHLALLATLGKRRKGGGLLNAVMSRMTAELSEEGPPKSAPHLFRPLLEWGVLEVPC